MDNLSALEQKIIKHAEEYYSGNATITDAQFDALVDELRAKNPDSPILAKTGWGYEIIGDKVKHPFVSVGGLQKRKVDSGDTVSFTVATPKYDGANAELIYTAGRFDMAISRGDGEYGQDITRHLRPIVPARLYPREGNEDFRFLEHSTVSISGEFCLSKESKERFYKDEMAFRNIPSGFLGRKESSDSECRHFSFMPYRINAIETDRLDEATLAKLKDRKTIQDILNRLFVVNVPTAEYQSYAEKPAYSDVMDYFDRYGFYYDGIVATNGSVGIEESEHDGFVLYRFSYPEIAYKTVTDFADVVITDIEWNLTRTGKLVPVANFEGVELSGAVVSRATLHNAYVVEANRLEPGSVIRVTRSGEVIPYVMGVIENGVLKLLSKT